MDIKSAIAILEMHNMWRTDTQDENGLVPDMPEPRILTKALQVTIKYYYETELEKRGGNSIH